MTTPCNTAQLLKPLFIASAALSLVITGLLVVIQYSHWALYAIGSLYGLIWLASYGIQTVPFVKTLNAGPALGLSLSITRVLGFAALTCWTGDFSLEKTTVVLIGCFSYKCVIVAFGVVSCGLALRKKAANTPS
jgi:hypothetical protein